MSAGEHSYQNIIIRSSTPPPNEKVGFWFQGFADAPPGRPPSSHNSEFDGPAMDPSEWRAPTMEAHDRVSNTFAPPVTRSPARSNATARLNEELNAESRSVPDYANVAEDRKSVARSVAHPAQASEAEFANHEPRDDPRHFSYESWGNLGAPRESTFGPMIIKPGDARKPGHTPAFAAGVPLPAMSEFGTPTEHYGRTNRGGATPSVVPITVEAPSEPPLSRQSSHAPSPPGQDEVASSHDDDPVADIPMSPNRVGGSQYNRPHSRAPSTAKAPSVAPSRGPTERSRAFSPEREIQSPRSNAPSQRYNHLGYNTPHKVALPMSNAGSTYGHSPSRAPSRFAGSVAGSRREAPSVAGSAQRSTISENRDPPRVASVAPSRSARAPTAYDDDDGSMETERSAAAPSHKPSTYRPTAPPADPSLYAGTPAKRDASLHPLTNHTRSVASQKPESIFDEPSAEDLLHAAVRGRAAASSVSRGYQPSIVESEVHPSRGFAGGDPGDMTPMQSRAHSPSRGHSPLNDEEQKYVDAALLRTPRTNRTSYTIAPSVLAAEVKDSHFHDNELCLLLHAADDPNSHDLVRSAMRKAIKGRLKKLGLKYDNDAVTHYRNSHTNMHAPPPAAPPVVVHVQQPEATPAWARGMMEALQDTQAKIERLDSKLSTKASVTDGFRGTPIGKTSKLGEYDRPNTDIAESEMQRSAYKAAEEPMYPGAGETEIATVRADSPRGVSGAGSIHHHDGSEHGEESGEEDFSDDESHPNRPSVHTPPHQDSDGHSHHHHDVSRQESAGHQYLQEELYKLRSKPGQSVHSHRTWEITPEGVDADGAETNRTETEAIPEIPDVEQGSAAGYADQMERRANSPDLPPIPRAHSGHESRPWESEWRPDSDTPPPWQRIHQRLLNWAIVWPMSELDQSLNSTLRGHQVNEVAMSIWATQTYKRYVRAKMMDHPRQTVDRLFVPPNIADAINNAVFNGRHGDACGMLRELWNPFGLEGMPRLLVVLARHRKDQNHWVVHRFSLPDGGLTTYDSFPERALPDGRPLGWWFAIRIAWPHAMYPSPDHLVQKIVRLHRPLQLLIDNSVAAAGVWRNILMGSRAERSIDLERLRDLINTEVKNLRQRKEMGKLSISGPKTNWEEIAA